MKVSALKFIFCRKKEKEKMNFKAVGTAGEARFRKNKDKKKSNPIDDIGITSDRLELPIAGHPINLTEISRGFPEIFRFAKYGCPRLARLGLISWYLFFSSSYHSFCSIYFHVEAMEKEEALI